MVLEKQCMTPLFVFEDFKVLYKSESDSLLCIIAGRLSSLAKSSCSLNLWSCIFLFEKLLLMLEK